MKRDKKRFKELESNNQTKIKHTDKRILCWVHQESVHCNLKQKDDKEDFINPCHKN